MSKAGSVSVKRVTADWVHVYNGFDVWRPLRLLRRIGPVVQGVTFDRTTSGDAYFPTAHIHALTRVFPVVSLTLGQRLLSPSGVQEAVKFAHHIDAYLEASRRLVEQSALSLTSAPTIGQIVAELHSFAMAQQERGNPPAVSELEDSIFIATVIGDMKLQDQGLQLASDLLPKWRAERLPPSFPGKETWLTGLRRKCEHPDELQVIVDAQVDFHGLGNIRQY